MDIQTGLVCVGVAVLSAVVIFVISMFGMKEKTYDEAIAEQRKMPEEHLLLGRSAKDKAKDKKQKKAGKKVKEKLADHEKTERSEVVASRALVSTPHEKVHVDFVEPEAEVVSERPPQEDKKKKKKRDKVKPILLNKNEQSLIVEVPLTPINHFEEILPKDDLLLKRKGSVSKEDVGMKGNRESAPKELPVLTQEVLKVTQTPVKGTVSNKTLAKPDKAVPTAPKAEKSSMAAPKAEKTVAAAPKVERPITTAPKAEKSIPPPATQWEPTIVAVQQQEVQLQPQVQSQPASVKDRSRKKKSELATLQQMSGDREVVNVSWLMPLVRKAELSRSEIQILIDLLLNKQQGSAVSNSEWFQGRQDPVVKLKKQLAEKEKALLEEQEASQAVQSKLKELRSELNAERSRLSHSTRQLEEALAAKTSDAQGLATRLQHQQDTHNADKQALVQQVQQLQAKVNEEHVHLRQAQDEVAQQQQNNGALQQEVLSQRQTLEVHITRLSEQRQEAEAAVSQLQAQLQEQEGVISTLQGHRERARQLEGQVLLYKEAADHAQDLRRQLEEHGMIRNDLDMRLSAVQQNEAALQYEVDKLRGSLAGYADVNEKLTAQLAAAQEITLDIQRLREDNDRLTTQVSLVPELQREAQQLREENESLAAQVTAVTERPAAEGRENGDAHFLEEEKQQSQRESISKEDLAHQDSIMKQKDSMLDQLGEELKQKDSLLEKLKSEINTNKTELHRLSKELEEQRSKNNDLRKKNWKAMDALSTMERFLQSKANESPPLVSEISQNVQLEERAAMKQLLQRIFPDIRVEENKVHEKWVERFEQSAKGFLSELKSQLQHVPEAEDQSEALVEFERQNSQLQTMVANYKTIIDETEGMLNKLQSHVEQEETRWRLQLNLKEAELEAARQELSVVSGTTAESAEMQTKLQVLEKEKRELDLKYAAAVSSYEQLGDEKVQLNLELESQLVKSRDLAKEVVKLKSQVQIGKDSLTQEQQLTLQLQEQVDRLNGSSENDNIATNGPASEPSITEGGSAKK